MLFKEDLLARLEAILFVSVEPLSEGRIGELLGLAGEELQEIIQEYGQSLDLPGRGIRLAAIGGGYKLETKASCWEAVEAAARPQGGMLSRAALETLAIIAYRQPVTRAEVESIRGVNSDAMFYRLLDRELITEVGRKEVPGHPNLYGTTQNFLLQLGLSSLKDLPPLDEFKEELLTQDELDESNQSLPVEIRLMEEVANEEV